MAHLCKSHTYANWHTYVRKFVYPRKVAYLPKVANLWKVWREFNFAEGIQSTLGDETAIDLVGI